MRQLTNSYYYNETCISVIFVLYSWRYFFHSLIQGYSFRKLIICLNTRGTGNIGAAIRSAGTNKSSGLFFQCFGTANAVFDTHFI